MPVRGSCTHPTDPRERLCVSGSRAGGAKRAQIIPSQAPNPKHVGARFDICICTKTNSKWIKEDPNV